MTNKTGEPTGNDVKVWSDIFARLKEAAYKVEPAIERFALDPKGNALFSDYNDFLSKVDDAVELATPFARLTGERFAINISNVAQDFAESYAYRYGAKASADITILTHHHLPIVVSYPKQIMLLMAGLVRSLRSSSPSAAISVSMQPLAKPTASADDSVVVISCAPFSKVKDNQTLATLIQELRNGVSSECLATLGIELAASLRLALRLSAEICVKQDTANQTALELSFNFTTPTKHYPRPLFPRDFYYCNGSPFLGEALDKVAAFHGVKAFALSSVEDLPPSGRLIYDATKLSADQLAGLQALPRPSDAVLLLASTDVYALRQLATYGFQHFLSWPLVSSKLFAAIAGIAPYKLPDTVTETKPKQKLRILVVDDAPTSRIVFRDHLESQGHYVAEASDGLEAVNFVQRGEKFDIIFCDLNMSHMDGLSALHKVREYEMRGSTYTPVVAATALGVLDGPEKLKTAGFDGVLLKPIDVQQVDKLLNDLVYAQFSNGIKRAIRSPVVIIDIEDLKVRCGGRVNTMVRVLESFIDSSKTYLPKLRSQEQPQGKVQIASMVHAIKGLLRDVGAKDGAQLLEKIENGIGVDGALSPDSLTLIEGVLQTACRKAAELKTDLIPHP